MEWKDHRFRDKGAWAAPFTSLDYWLHGREKMLNFQMLSFLAHNVQGCWVQRFPTLQKLHSNCLHPVPQMIKAQRGCKIEVPKLWISRTLLLRKKGTGNNEPQVAKEPSQGKQRA